MEHSPIVVPAYIETLPPLPAKENETATFINEGLAYLSAFMLIHPTATRSFSPGIAYITYTTLFEYEKKVI